jgi:hypothetical protein
MAMHLSGRPHGCRTYQVLWWAETESIKKKIWQRVNKRDV